MNNNQMRAATLRRYGPPTNLKIEQVPKPSPGEGELLVKVHATSATAADCMMRRADPFIARFFLGFLGPKIPIPGTGFSGEIESIGPKVTKFKVGDQVFGETGVAFAANAEYLCIAESGVVAEKPDSLLHEEAAPTCDGAITSLNFLKNIAELSCGQKILIIGAAGSLGTAAVQIAHHMGAAVTGVCSTANIELVKSLGADEVIDYTKEDFGANGQTYDVIYDTIGKSSFAKCRSSLAERGIYMSPVLGLRLLLQMMKTRLTSGKKAKFSATGLLPAPQLREMLGELIALYEVGALKTVIDRRYKLEEIAAAHAYIETGHKKGNIVLTPLV